MEKKFDFVIAAVLFLIFFTLGGMLYIEVSRSCIDKCNASFSRTVGAPLPATMLEKCYEACKECDK